jgi:hypothetical protein
VLRVTGGAAHGLGRTYQAICYSAGASVTMAVPCIGIYPFAFVGLAWWLVSAILMLTVGQKIHPGRAVFATILFPVLAGLAVVFGGATLAMYGVSQARSFAVQASSMQQEAECDIMLAAIIGYADSNKDRWPIHAIEMVPGDMVTAYDFVAGDWMTSEAAVPLADTTLEIAGGMTPGARRQLIDAVVALQPPDVVAHRVGDFVYTYHGLARDDPSGLWLVIMSPDPVANTAGSIERKLLVGRLDGSVETIEEGEFADRLAEQNDLRAGRDLPPIPDPATVTHAVPVTGGAPPDAGGP